MCVNVSAVFIFKGKITLVFNISIKSKKNGPGWCGSVAWVPACKPRGRWIDPQSGHMPGLWARSPVGGVRANHTLMFLSLSFSLPSSLFKNKYIKSFFSPGWYGSVDWAMAWQPKGHLFNSPSGHMPGLWARFPSAGCVRGNYTLMFLSFSLPSPLSKDK